MIQIQDWKINLQFQSPGLIPSHSSNTWPGNKSVPGDSSLPGRFGPGGGSAPGGSGHWAAPPAGHSAQARRSRPASAPAPLHVRRTPRAPLCGARLAPPSLPPPAPPVRASHWLRSSSLRPQHGRPPPGRKSRPTSRRPHCRLA